jgi:molybdenum cofactor cytidylyltransferase
MEPREAGVVILAAGKSERMKELKALLPFTVNMSFLEKILVTYTEWGCKEIVVVTNPEAFQMMEQKRIIPDAISVVVNDHLEFERFYSVKLGLGALRSSSFCFIQNVDNPFIGSSILDLIYENRSQQKYISPVFENKGGHPVLLNLENIAQILKWPLNSANFKDVLKTMHGLDVAMPDDTVLININSPEEYQKFFNQ